MREPPGQDEAVVPGHRRVLVPDVAPVAAEDVLQDVGEVLVSPSLLTFTTANDAPERDPIAFELSGSNDSIDGPWTLIADGKSYRQFLNPGDAPEAVFKVSAGKPVAREYCNLHGLWKA